MMQYSFETSGALKVPSPEQLKELDNDTAIIAFTNGTTESGTPYYAYVAVRPSMYQEFYMLTKAKQPMVLGEFGTIIACGAQFEPPEDVVMEMQDLYGFDPQYENKLREEVGKQRGEFVTKQENDRLGGIVSKLKGDESGIVDVTAKSKTEDDQPQTIKIDKVDIKNDQQRLDDIVNLLKKNTH